MKASEIRDLDDSELSKRLAEMRKEVFGLRFSNATGELDDTAGIGRAKRDLARTLTGGARARAGTAVRTGQLRTTDKDKAPKWLTSKTTTQLRTTSRRP